MIHENKVETLKFKVPWFPYLTLISIWVQISCLAVMVFTPALRASLYVGVPVLVLPMIFYKVKEVLKAIRQGAIKPTVRP